MPGRPDGARQPTALDGRERLAHHVHLVDGRAGSQQGAIDRLFVVERDPLSRERQKR